MSRPLNPLPALAAGLAGLVLASGCSNGGGATEPLAASAVPSPASPSPEPSPSPVPSPSPSPSPAALSPFEGDPAVQGVRTFAAAVAAAVNAKNLKLPALVAASTPARAQRNPEIYRADLGSYFPGPVPLLPRAVRTVSATRKSVLGCSVEDGYALTKQGGTPVKPLSVVAVNLDVRLVSGTWRLNDATLAEGLDCSGLTVKDLT